MAEEGRLLIFNRYIVFFEINVNLMSIEKEIYRVAQKLKAKGLGVGEIADIFECSTRTVYRWLEMKEHPSNRKRGRKSAIGIGELSKVEELLQKSPASTIKTIKTML